MATSLARIWGVTFPPKPAFTEKDVPDLAGKVYIVTGANTGVGKELSRMLYSRNAKVYVTARSQDKADRAIRDIKAAAEPASTTGALAPLVLDLADLGSVAAAAHAFAAAEPRLHVLFNNAGYMGPDEGGAVVERTPQGHEMHLGVNCLGPFLLTKLLTPTLIATARHEARAGAVRVVFLSSLAAEVYAERDTIVDMGSLDFGVGAKARGAKYRYGISKAGNWIYAHELSKRLRDEGIIALGVNPGNLRSDLFRSQGAVLRALMGSFNYPVVNGAYTELWAGLSPEVTLDKAGSLVNPFGRFGEIRSDWEKAIRSEAEGGNGTAHEFWQWSEGEVSRYI